MKTLKSKVLDKLNRKETGKLIKIKIDDVEDEFKTDDKSEKEVFQKKLSELNQLNNHYRRKATKDFDDETKVNKDGTIRE